MIKQIQLRGISHSPSDKLTADGGLEDCIDMRYVDGEHVPATPPQDVSTEGTGHTLAPGLLASGIDVMYIHKSGSYTNYVGVYGTTNLNIKAYIYNESLGTPAWQAVTIRSSIGAGVTPVSFTSVGNVLIFTLSNGTTGYALYRNHAYLDLGDSVPKPTVTIESDAQTAQKVAFNVRMDQDYTTLVNRLGDYSSAWEFWTNEILQKKDEDGEANIFYNQVVNFFWETVAAKRKSLRGDDIFSAPVLARYALRLYDGSYVYVSEPILLAGGTSNMDLANNLGAFIGLEGQNNVHYRYFQTEAALNHLYKAKVTATIDNVGNWKELIESLDIFISTDILIPKENALFSKGAKSTIGPEYSESFSNMYSDFVSINYDGVEYLTMQNVLGSLVPVSNDAVPKDTFRKEIEEKANFYLVASYNLNDLPTSKVIKPLSQDELVVSERLLDGEAHSIIPTGDVFAFNNRLLSGSQQATLSPAHTEPHALIENTGTSTYYSIYYHVLDGDGSDHLVKGYDSIQRVDAAVRAYVAYPDPRCYQADLYKWTSSTVTKVTLPMKEHPRLNCAYGFWGLDSKLDTPNSDDRSSATASLPSDSSLNPVYAEEMRFALSEVDNPFYFPIGARQRFSSKILGAVPVTMALSTSQYGMHDIYVFTGDGIWTIALNDEGGISNTHPLTREVAVKGTITQLDNAAVFISHQGVMLLEGGSVSCLSPYMQGPEFSLDGIAPAGSALRTALTSDGWWPLVSINIDTTDFQEFIEGCKPLYDYANKRILFLNTAESYAYEYALDSQTWHKHSASGFARTLNGYPQAYSVMSGKIYDWSVLPDYNAVSPESRKGLIITRPFDLDAPDVRKAIKSIRIRGISAHSDVKYMLLGTMNGIAWSKLLSLRGGSYKSFRLVILADLTPGECVSWVDVDFDTRWATKLR